MKKIGTSSIFYEKYKPQCIEDLILPDELKKKLISSIENQKIPHMLLASSIGGCILPGTNIHVFKEKQLMSIDEISKVLKVSKQRIKYLLCSDNDLYDFNDITAEIMIVLNDKTQKSLKCMAADNSYIDKHLKLSHWLTKYNLAEAIKKTNTLRKYKIFFDFDIFDDYWNNWKKENLFNTVQEIKFNMVYSEFDNLTSLYNVSNSILTTSFWKFRGYSDAEINDIISTIQRKRSILCYEYWEERGYDKIQYDEMIIDIQRNNNSKRTSKYTSEELSKQRGYGQSIEKFINLGYSEEESKKLLSERQTTFSLGICINKYGKEEGTRIFNERQTNWQNTLNSKPQEEIDDINAKKGITLDNMIRKWGEDDGKLRYNKWLSSTNPALYNKLDNETPGKLYYIRFFNDEIEFWKIGITKLDVENGRFHKKDVFFKKYNLHYDIIFVNDYDTVVECFKKEQFILQTFWKNRCNINYNGFQTSEAFDTDILKEFYEKV